MIKVQKRDYPVIFIGLGGTGKAAILAIKKKFSERLICEENSNYPRRTAFLVLDADGTQCGAGRPINEDEYINLTVNNTETILDPQNRAALPDYERDWLSPDITPAAFLAGAGGIRQIGRFQLFRHVADFKQKFAKAVDTNARVDAQAGNVEKKVDVVICGGLCGGTGSGTFLDVAYLVKHWLKEKYPEYDCNTYGFFTLPDVQLGDSRFQSLANDTDKAELMKAGAYAALKELDYWMHDRDNSNKMSFTQRYGSDIEAKWGEAPFKLAFLMDNKRRSGTPIHDPYEHILSKISEMMLYCYADEEGTEFTFESYMSNVSQGLLHINEGAENNVPINYSFASLGVSTTEAVEQTVNAYETKLVLERVLSVTLVNDDNSISTGEAALEDSGAETSLPPAPYFNKQSNVRTMYRRLLGDMLVFTDVQTDDDCFRAMMQNELQDFGTQNKYEPIEPQYQEIVDADEALFTENIKRYAGNSEMEKTWEFNAKNAADRMLYQEKQRFEEASKEYIRDIHVGPVSWLNFLQDTLLPRLEWLRDAWNGENSTDSQQYTGACDQAQKLSASLRSRNLLAKAFTFATSNSTLEDYASHERTAVIGRRNGIYSGWRRNGFTQLIKSVTNYIRTLSFMLDALNGIASKSEEQLQVKEEKNQFVTVGSLREYLNGQGAAKDLAIATARDNIWAQLAEDSFNVGPQGLADSEKGRQEERNALLTTVYNFLEDITTQMQMDNLDWMIRAQIPGDDDLKKEERVEYVRDKLRNTLDQAAEIMLPVNETDTNFRLLGKEYAYISVPEKAKLLQEGFKSGDTWVKKSMINDRVLCLKMCSGISAANVVDTYDLQKAYEKHIGTSPKLCAGLHLVDSCPATRFKQPSWYAEYSWCLLPSLISYELFPDQDSRLSQREKDNWEYANEIFKAAMGAQLVDFDQDSKCFRLKFMKQMVHHDEFKRLVDEIANDSTVGAYDRKEALERRQNEWMTITEPLYYTQYEQRAYGLMKVETPKTGASPVEMVKYEQNKLAARVRLCAYLVMRHPQYLKQLQVQLDNMKYFAQKMGEVQREIDRLEEGKSVYKQFTRLIVSGRLFLDSGMFCLKTDSGDVNLFELDFEEMGFGSITNFSVQDGIKKYVEACFLLQYSRRKTSGDPEKELKTATQNKLDFMLGRYVGAMRDFKENAPELHAEYVQTFRTVYERYDNYVGSAEHMSDIDGDDSLGRGSVVRDTLKAPYAAMLEVMRKDRTAL